MTPTVNLAKFRQGSFGNQFDQVFIPLAED
jgi:hypothetical protein